MRFCCAIRGRLDAYVMRTLLLAAGGLTLLQAQGVDRKRIALYDFDYSSVKARVAQDIGPSYNIGANISALLLSPLTTSGAYDVVDRARMEQVFKEQNMRFSERFDSTKAVAFGRILGVDAIVAGTVDNVYVEYKQKVKGVLGVGKKRTEVHAIVEITAQMISTETAQIFLAPSARGEASEEISSEIGGTVQMPNQNRYGQRQIGGTGGSGSQTIAHNPAEPVLRQAIRNATEKLAQEMIAKAPTLPRRSTAPGRSNSRREMLNTAPTAAPKSADLRGSVLDVSASTVFIDKGSAAGVQPGDRFEIRRFLRSVTNGKGQAIKLDKKIGLLEVSDVSSDFSSGTYSGETPPQKNDIAIKIARQ